MRLGAALALAAGALALAAPSAGAAGPPLIPESWVTDVTATGAKLRAKIEPNGLSTTYRFEYVTQAKYEASGFSGAAKAPPSGAQAIGSVPVPPVVQSLGDLTPATAYRYRPVATNSAGSTTGPEHLFATQASSLEFGLPDDRAWELVSPVDKGGGAIAAPGSLFGGGHFQAAANGDAVTYGSASAFGDAAGSPPGSQYLSRRTSAAWLTENVSTPLESAAYGDSPDGTPYRAFSEELGHGLLFGGLPCRSALPGCPAPNPVLPGSGAPPGHMAYYLRDGATGSYDSLLGAGDLAHTSVSAEQFEVSFATATPSLSGVVLSSCAALTADAVEILAGPGECDEAEQNLYLWSSAGLKLLNLKPGDPQGTPGAEIGAPIGAISENGSRVYFSLEGDLYLREGNQSFAVEKSVEDSDFQTASSDGSVAFFSKEDGHLYRFLASTKAVTDLTPAGGVVGVLGASADGTHLYLQDATGLKHWHSGTTTTVAPGADATLPSDYPPSVGTSRVSADGEHLAFLSKAELTGNDVIGANTGLPVAELYLYGPPPGGGAPQLLCASCNPTGERPQGQASIPGALLNGSTIAYRPRVLSSSGNRLFFTSEDELVVEDTNSRPDAYQWEAKGVGDCDRSPGCARLISSGRSLEGASFIDASADGSDAYFITDESLVASDPGSIDLYDARVDGGIAEAPKPFACVADACQSLPAPPDDPTPGTLTPNAGNPALRILGEKSKANRCRRKKGAAKRRCLRNVKRQAKRGGRR